MLEEKDYKKIGKIFEEKSKKLEKRIIGQIGEVIEDNVLPILDKHGKQLERLGGKMETLGGKMNNLPDKAYLDDKLANLEGSVIVRQRKEDQKVNLLIEFLKEKKVLQDREVNMLQEIEVFPKPPKVC